MHKCSPTQLVGRVVNSIDDTNCACPTVRRRCHPGKKARQLLALDSTCTKERTEYWISPTTEVRHDPIANHSCGLLRPKGLWKLLRYLGRSEAATSDWRLAQLAFRPKKQVGESDTTRCAGEAMPAPERSDLLFDHGSVVLAS